MKEIKEEADRLVELYLPHQTGTIDKDVLDNFKEDVRKGKSKIVAMMDFSKKYKATQCAIIDVSNTMKVCFDEEALTMFNVEVNTYPHLVYEFQNQVKQELESRLNK